MNDAQAYWARFEPHGEQLFRFDTRVYLDPVAKPRRRDAPIGCIVGKNPGSAVPATIRGGLQAIALQGDHFLPSVRAITAKAVAAVGVEPAPGAYVQVLNLFYVCNRDLRTAKRALAAQDRDQYLRCATERRSFAWRWFAWGGPDTLLDPLKTRFLRPRRAPAFYFDGASGEIVTRAPRLHDKARHTQGLAHTPIVTHLAALMRTRR